MTLTISDTVQLGPGVAMPRFGLGTYKTADGEEVESAVSAALDAGYRSIDTASLYGNEEGIGRALARSGIPRDKLFVTTKIWNDEQGYENTLAASHRSLERLGLSYVDLYLIHWPIPQFMEETWRAMEELLGEGHVRGIGVCNFLEPDLEQLLEIAEFRPRVNQFEFHPRLQQPALVQMCDSENIIVEAWAPLMRGGVFDIPEITSIGAAHGKSNAQVTLRWILQRGIVAIPKSVHAERIEANAAIFDFELTSDEMATLDGLDREERVGRHPSWVTER